MENIVSLTSYPPRYSGLHLCLASIFTQCPPPDQVILTIYRENQPLPDLVLDYEKLGLKILYVHDDLKPHNKYFYVMRMYPDDCIITLDDDCLYPSDLVSKLVYLHQHYPDCIVAGRAHGMQLDENGKLLPYRKWDWEAKSYNTPSLKLMATGVGGVLYPPNCLSAEVFNIDKLRELCLLQDDVWLKIMQLRKGKRVIQIYQDHPHPKPVPGTSGAGLYLINKYAGGTDICLRNVSEHFGINWKEMLGNE